MLSVTVSDQSSDVDLTFEPMSRCSCRWNPVYQPDGPFFSAPEEGRVQQFQQVVRSQYGLHCTIRQEKGQDISGACGQLVIEHGVNSQQHTQCNGPAAAGSGTAAGVRDIEELADVPTAAK